MRYTVRRQLVLLTSGDLNGAIKLSLVAFQVAQEAFAFSLRIILNLIFWKPFRILSGRYIVCNIKTDEKLFTLANSYDPDEDDPTFFQQVFDHLHDFVCEEIVLGGDFNLVVDVKEDKKSGLPRTYQNALKIINQNCQELNWCMESTKRW